MYFGAFFPTPFTDYFAIITPNYRVGLQNDFCAKLERRLYNCVEAYGNEKAKTKCLDIFYDVFECSHNTIELHRASEIRKERERKYKAGEIDEKFSEKPPLDSFFYM